MQVSFVQPVAGGTTHATLSSYLAKLLAPTDVPEYRSSIARVAAERGAMIDAKEGHD